MSTDAIVLLKEDHQRVRKLFRDFEAAGENATTRKRDLVGKMIEELTIHTYIENEIMYPEVRKRVPDIDDDILESYEEHHVADVLCLELFTMSPESEHYDAKTTVLIESVEHHIKEEEDVWFPKVREAMGRKELSELGERMLEAKKKAPHTPIAPKALKKALDALVK
jgi:iron-sulfur cluster repair protein YtfE (RIC family)